MPGVRTKDTGRTAFLSVLYDQINTGGGHR